MVGLYLVAGLNHFWNPDFYRKIMTPWLGWHHELILLSGFFEILFALLLIPKTTRRFAAYGIIAMLIVIFPANIQMAINYYHQNNPQLWIALVRLPIQFLLIWWAASHSNVQNRSAGMKQ
jgi:uncharacterized membrane protein